MKPVKQNRAKDIYSLIRNILNEARSNVVKTVNFTMVKAYWNIGKIIVEEQEGKERVEYGKYLLKELSEKLTSEFGKGFTETDFKKALNNLLLSF